MTNKELEVRHGLNRSLIELKQVRKLFFSVSYSLDRFKKVIPKSELKINQILTKYMPSKQVELFLQELDKLNKENKLQIDMNEQFFNWLYTDEGRTETFKLWKKESLKKSRL
jgi:hypothetical protein